MGKNQTNEKHTQSQGVCEKIFKAVIVCEAFQSFRRNSPAHPQTQSPKSATKPTVSTTDHHRHDLAKSSISKPVALHQPPAEHGSTIPFQLKDQQIPLHKKDQNMVLVEYNHSSGDTVNKSPVNIISVRDHQQNQGPEVMKAEPVNKSTMENMYDKVHKPNKDPKVVKSEDYNDISSDRFTKYIDHVKNKLKHMSSFDGVDDDGSVVGRAATRRDSFNDKNSLY